MDILKKRMYLHMDYTIQKILFRRVSFRTYYQKYLQLILFFKNAGLLKFLKKFSSLKIDNYK
jgi:hypothetical protein